MKVHIWNIVQKLRLQLCLFPYKFIPKVTYTEPNQDHYPTCKKLKTYVFFFNEAIKISTSPGLCQDKPGIKILYLFTTSAL